jgi:hypothetical protein
MPSGGLGDDEDTAAVASFGTVHHPLPLTKSADLQTALAPPDADAFGTKIYENVGLSDFKLSGGPVLSRRGGLRRLWRRQVF